MAVGRFDYDYIPGLDRLTGTVDIYSLSGILESYLEIIPDLFLTDAGKPVIYLQLAATLPVAAIQFSFVGTIYLAAAGTVVLFVLIIVFHTSNV